MTRPSAPASPFRYFNSSPEVIRLAVLLYVNIRCACALPTYKVLRWAARTEWQSLFA